MTRAERNIRWIERNCCVPEGSLVGNPILLRDWQKYELKRIYDNPHGTRRAILSFARKNGKTALAALLLLVHLCGPEGRDRPNSQLFSAAQSRDQAALLFNLAAKIVRMSPRLRDHIVIRETAKQLACPGLGTLYRALSAEATTAYGLSPVFTVHDELGQVRGPRSAMYEALETATGAQTEPLSIIISTQAPTDADLLSVLIDHGLSGKDPRVVVSLYTTPVEADPFARESISLANPALGDFLNEVEVMAMAADAREMPSRENEFRNLILNQRVDTVSPLFSANVWAGCGRIPHPIDKKTPLYAGLDLSATQDLTAFVTAFRTDGIISVHSTFWLPAEGLDDKSRIDKVPYSLWQRQGTLQTSPGRSVDYSFVAEHLRKVTREFNYKKIAFDRWNMRHLRPWLVQAGFGEREIDTLFVEFGQGIQSMSPAIRELEAEVVNQRLAHGNHPVLKMNAANAVVWRDPAGNRKLDKSKSTGRIDGLVALVMAVGSMPSSSAPVLDIRAMVA